MKIYRQDGSFMSVRRPNPVMEYQEMWQDYKIHNINPTEITTEKIIEQPVFVQNVPKTEKWFLLRAEKSTYKDDLYDEEKIEVKYTDKQEIEVFPMEDNGFSCRLLTNKPVSNSSVFYNQLQRIWWKVTDCTQHTRNDKNYFVVNCLISDVQPSF